MTFRTQLEKFNSNLWTFHFAVPDEAAVPFLGNKSRRVICKINEKIEFQCALMPKGDGSFFINLNKKHRDTLGCSLGDPLTAELRADESEYGLPMPDELREIFKLDDEASHLFHALTPGKQRTLLHIISTVKNSDLRISRALTVIDHLRRNHGKIDFKKLGEAFKNN